MPKVSVPVVEGKPASGSVGRVTRMPLLSDAKAATGFWSWLARAWVVTWHDAPEHA